MRIRTAEGLLGDYTKLGISISLGLPHPTRHLIAFACMHPGAWALSRTQTAPNRVSRTGTNCLVLLNDNCINKYIYNQTIHDHIIKTFKRMTDFCNAVESRLFTDKPLSDKIYTIEYTSLKDQFALSNIIF